MNNICKANKYYGQRMDCFIFLFRIGHCIHLVVGKIKFDFDKKNIFELMNFNCVLISQNMIQKQYLFLS